MNPRRFVLSLLGLLLAGLLALTACGGSSTSAKKDDDGKKAAEPATSPALSVKPAGQVFDVAPGPQGTVYDATTDTLAVAVRQPYRVLLLDPTTLKVRKSVEVPGKVRHLQLAAPGGPVLAGSETANTAYEIDITTGKKIGTKVQRHPHDIAGADNGDILVGNEFSGSLSFVRDGKLLKTLSDLRQPGSVVTQGNTAAVIDVGDYSVSTYDIAGMRRVGRIAAGKGPTHGVITGDNRLLVGDTRGDEVILYSLSPLKELGRLSTPGSPYGMATDPTTQTAWVTLTGKNELIGIDVSGTTPKVIARYPTVEQPDTVAVAPGSKILWVTGTDKGVIQRITR